MSPTPAGWGGGEPRAAWAPAVLARAALHRRLWRAGGKVHFNGTLVLPTWQYEVSPFELPVLSGAFPGT